MSKRPKILYLVGTDPRNTSYGGEQRTHFIWEALKKVAEVHTVIPVAHKRSERVDESDNIRWVCFERRWTPGWIFNRVWNNFFPRVGLAFGLRPLSWVLKRVMLRPDFCVTRYVYTASRFKAWGECPLILDVDDLESEVFDSLNANRRGYLNHFVRCFIRRYENWVVGKACHVWVTNPVHLPNVSARTVMPNITNWGKVDYSLVLGDPDVLLFVGHGSSMPNYEGVDVFLARYWKDLRKLFPSLQLKITGRGYPDFFQKKWRQYPGVVMLGFVKDLSVLYRDCLCAINPVEVGSGSCIKTIEALSYGRVCVATVSGARGLPNDGNSGVFRFTDKSTLLSLLTTLRDTGYRIEAQKQARSYCLTFHSPAMVDKTVGQTLKRCMRKESWGAGE